MGDRANFGFKDSQGNTLFLYGHWAGHQMLGKLANAVEHSRSRWGDHGYATRVCVSQLVGDDKDHLTGWGLYINQIADNEHHIPVINWATGTFGLYEYNWSWGDTKIKFVADEPKFTITLDEFVNKYAKVLTP
jgi:hypothetical protein